MRVAVIGAGAVGGTIAALLARSGHTVAVTARGGHLAAIAARGLRISGAWGDYTADLEIGETLRRQPELALVTTKAQDARAAMAASAPMLSGIPVVVVQNGLSGLTTARTALPASSIVGGIAVFAASFLSPGEIVVTAKGRMYVGGDDERGRPSHLAARLLADAMPTDVLDDFAGAQWTKLVINQVNALPAITGLSAQEVIADRALRRILTDSMREAVRIGLASGVRFAAIQGLSHRTLQLFSSAPHVLAQLLPSAMGRRMGDVPNPGSTLQSIRRGQPTEIDYLNGAVVDAARSIGAKAPINAQLVQLVHEVERSGASLPVQTALTRLAALS